MSVSQGGFIAWNSTKRPRSDLATRSLCWRMAGGLIESHIAPAFANSFGPAFWEMPCMLCTLGFDMSRRQPRDTCHHRPARGRTTPSQAQPVAARTHAPSGGC